MKCFSSFILSDAYLAERALDVEFGDAGDRFWTLVSKETLDIMEQKLRVLGLIFQDGKGEYGGDTFATFNDIYYWVANMPKQLPEPLWSKWDSAVESILNRVQTKHTGVVIGSMPEIADSIVVQIGMTDKFTVIPKSIKKEFDRFEFGKQMYITLGGGSITSKDPNDKGSAGGYYSTLRRKPSKGMSGTTTYNSIVVGKILSLTRKSVRKVTYEMYCLRTKPTKWKAAMSKWIAELSSDLKSQTKTGIHEYMHLLDAVRYKTPIETSPKGFEFGAKAGWQGEYTTYYKSHHEWQAHFQDAATTLRKNLRAFLEAMVNKGTVADIIANKMQGKSEKDKIDHWNGWNEHVRGTGFDASKRGAFIARVINDELGRVIPSLTMDTTWKFGFKANQTIDLESLRADKFTALAYSYMERYSHGATEWLKDDEMRKRFLKRIASLADDLRKITNDFYAELKSGKSPSKQRWNQAMDEVHGRRYLYVGSLMRSRATDVYDVRLFFNQYEMP